MNSVLKKVFVVFVCAGYLTLAIMYLQYEPYDHVHLKSVQLDDYDERTGAEVVYEFIDEFKLEDNPNVIPVLVLACNRSEALRTVLEQVLSIVNQREFPITVSLDCDHEATEQVAHNFGVKYIKQPDQSTITSGFARFNREGYHRLSRHYHWALGQMVNVHHPKAKTLIILEDDLNVSKDLFAYFSAFSELLQRDTSLLCVSGFNDNGKRENVELANPCQLWRTDFFPGLGWMTTSNIIRELIGKWPAAYWDDWLREPDQAQGRSCIRPEVSKTTTFGRFGVSSGLYFDLHLAKIRLNNEQCKYGTKEIEAMWKKSFDYQFRTRVEAAPAVSIDFVSRIASGLSVRVICNTTQDWKVVSELLGIMPDIRFGTARTGYDSVVPTLYRNSRIFVDIRNLAPDLKLTPTEKPIIS